MEKIEPREFSAAAEVCQEMEKPDIIKSIGFLSAIEFLVGYLKESEASDFSFVKANVQLRKLSETFFNLKEAGNSLAEILLNRLRDLTLKNWVLTTAAILAKSRCVSEPQEITISSFAPCTSVSVDRFVSTLHSFLPDRSHKSEATMLEMLFVQYNIKSF